MSTPNNSVSNGTITTPPPSPVNDPSIPARNDPRAITSVNPSVFKLPASSIIWVLDSAGHNCTEAKSYHFKVSLLEVYCPLRGHRRSESPQVRWNVSFPGAQSQQVVFHPEPAQTNA